MSKISYLDADELLHLAITASKNNDHETAIINLKQALEIAPDNPKVHYFLGAEHAQIGLYDRAIEEMTRAVNLDPDMVTAVFQLGLLHLTSGKIDAAIETWALLDKLGDDHYLYLFKKGMISLARDEFDECEKCLKQGIALNHSSEALNNDMQKVISEIEARRNNKQNNTAESEQSTTDGNHFFLSNYLDSE
ncbi:MAG: tetratricopeptide repeat protein [Pseudomonadota bacterium]